MTIAEFWQVGSRVKIVAGNGFFEDCMSIFRRPTEDVFGTVRAVRNGTIYVVLDDGRRVHTSAHLTYTPILGG